MDWDQFGQEIVFRYTHEKVTIELFFLSSERLGISDVNKICNIAESCFEKMNLKLQVLGWCGNYQMNLQRTNFGNNLNYRLTFSYINNSKVHWQQYINYNEEINFCTCDICTAI